MNKHKPHPVDEILQTKIVSQLNDQADRLDPATRYALDRARRKALNAAVTGRTGWTSSGWIAAPALITAALLLAVVIKPFDRDPTVEPPPMTADLDIITDPHFELLVEDPDFIAWLVEADAAETGTEHSG
jgi:hypothetical protein